MALLDGLLHCYTPSLGPTGYRLIDRGPRRIHGTTTTVATGNWVASGLARPSGWSLSVSGAQSYTGCGGISASSARTLSGWFRTSVVLAASGQHYFVEGGAAVLNQSFTLGMIDGRLVGAGAGNFFAITQRGQVVLSAGWNDGFWHHAFAWHIGNDYTLYIDGKPAATGTMTTTPTSGSVTVGDLVGGGAAWSGSIGEIAYWQRASTAAEAMDIFRRGDGGLGRMLTGQSYREARLSQAIATTTNRRRRLICGSQC